MARKLIVEIVGDDRSLERTLTNSQSRMGRFGGAIGAVGKTAVVAGAGIAVGLGVVLKKSVDAAMDAERSNKQWAASVKSVGESLKTATPIMNRASENALRLGFSDEEARDSLSRLTVATHSSAQASKLLASAEDLARLKHISLTAASTTLQGALTGSQRAAKQLGIVVPAVSTNLDKLTAAHKAAGTEATKAEIAHAKILDKYATGQAVIDQVTDKLHGQAQAYTETAAGGMEVFRARLDEVFENIGMKLLPIMNQTLQWVNAHWPQISAVIGAVADGIGYAIHNVIGPAFQVLKAGIAELVTWTRSHWDQIKAHIDSVVSTVRAIISGFITVATALWDRFGSTIEGIVRRDFAAVRQIIENVVNIISGVFSLIGDLIHGRWSKVWDDMKKIVSNTIGIIVTVIRTEVQNIFAAAMAIGKAIVEGAWAGIEALADWVKSKISGFFHGLVSAAKEAVGAKSPATEFIQIGRDMGEGTAIGWVAGTADLPSKMKESLRNAIEAARREVDAGRTRMAAAFSAMTTQIDAAFSAIRGATPTKSESLLGALVSKHDAAEFKSNLKDAKQALKDATTPEEIAAAQQRLNDLLYQQKVENLQKAAEQERKDADARAAVDQLHLDAALARLQAHWAKYGVTTEQAQQDILKLLKKYGVSFAAVGADMGVAWIKGLKETISAAASGGGSLKDIIARAAADITVPKAASGGIVSKPTLLLAGEAGPEAIVPLSRAGGLGGGVTVHVYGFVGSERQLVDAIHDGLLRKKKTGATIGLA